MSIFDVVNKIKDITPSLAQAIASTNPISQVLYSAVTSIFGANKNDPTDLLAKINADPEAAIKLKKIEFDHQEEMAKINSETYKTEVEDRKNAREREINLHDWVPTILAIGFLINYAAIQFYCVTHQNQANDIISARFQDVLIMIISYYFGGIHKKISHET